MLKKKPTTGEDRQNLHIPWTSWLPLAYCLCMYTNSGPSGGLGGLHLTREHANLKFSGCGGSLQSACTGSDDAAKDWALTCIMLRTSDSVLNTCKIYTIMPTINENQSTEMFFLWLLNKKNTLVHATKQDCKADPQSWMSRFIMLYSTGMIQSPRSLQMVNTHTRAPCRLRGCTNRSALFPGRMS